MRPIIYPYKMGSRSARALAESLRSYRSLRVRENGNYRLHNNHLIINWGNPRMPAWGYLEGAGRLLRHPHLINYWDDVAVAQNKLLTYQALEGQVNIPEFTTDGSVAGGWLEDNQPVLGRKILNGHGGIGIEYLENEGDLPSNLYHEYPLYVKYIKKRDEYRIHVFQDQVIDIQQKRKERNNDDVNFQIRNHANGWVFCREDVNPPNEVLSQALLAVQTLGLDFGAVDVGWNEYHEQATVYEINTAPGLEGTTLENYSNAIRRLL